MRQTVMPGRGRARFPAFVLAALTAGWTARPAMKQAPEAARPPDHSMSVYPVTAAGAQGGDLMAVVLSGDGGFRKLDHGVADALVARGIPVLGWNSLAYYRKKRTPEEAAALLQRGLEQYLAAWHRHRVVLVGYSFGADVLPFLVNRLTPDLQARVIGVALLGFSGEAAFHFHIMDWFGKTVGTTLPTLPELNRMPAMPVLCLAGHGDKWQACASVTRPGSRRIILPTGHRLDSRTDEVAADVVDFVRSLPGVSLPGD